MFEICIYKVEGNSNTNKYHLVLCNKLDNTKTRFIASATSQQELYGKAFEAVENLRKSSLLIYIEQRQSRLQEQEKISLGLGKTFLKLQEQERATYYFHRANSFNRQRNELEQEVASLISSSLSYLSSVPAQQ